MISYVEGNEGLRDSSRCKPYVHSSWTDPVSIEMLKAVVRYATTVILSLESRTGMKTLPYLGRAVGNRPDFVVS